MVYFFSFGGAVPEPPRGGFRLPVEEEALFPLPPSPLLPSCWAKRFSTMSFPRPIRKHGGTGFPFSFQP